MEKIDNQFTSILESVGIIDNQVRKSNWNRNKRENSQKLQFGVKLHKSLTWNTIYTVKDWYPSDLRALNALRLGGFSFLALHQTYDVQCRHSDCYFTKCPALEVKVMGLLYDLGKGGGSHVTGHWYGEEHSLLSATVPNAMHRSKFVGTSPKAGDVSAWVKILEWDLKQEHIENCLIWHHVEKLKKKKSL